jgi:hypothetical protein
MLLFFNDFNKCCYMLKLGSRYYSAAGVSVASAAGVSGASVAGVASDADSVVEAA